MSVGDAWADLSRRLPGSAGRIERLAAIAAAVVFWGWLLARWFNDWVLARLGFGPGADESFLSPAPFEAAAASAAATADSLASLRLVVWVVSVPVGRIVGTLLDWTASVLDGVALAVEIAPALADGAWFTIVLTAVSVVLGFTIAVPLAVIRVYGGAIRWIALGYTELIRGTPLLAQLFVLYYGLPLAIWLNDAPLVGEGIVPDQTFWIAILGFTINGSAYQAEYIRGALESVDEGQLTAARAIGLSKFAGIRHVVLPQTLRYAIPAWTNELVYLIKYSSLAAFVTVPELFYRASRIASSTFEYTPIFTLLALVYLGMVLTATNLMGRLERRVAVPGLGRVEGRQQGGG